MTAAGICCSFCGAQKPTVMGPDVSICFDCIRIAGRVAQLAEANAVYTEDGGSNPSPTQPDERVALINATVDDLVADFMYYDRKEDGALPRGAIEKAVADGAITVDDIVARFAEQLHKNFPRK